MITLQRTNARNPHFLGLVALLNTELARRDGGDHPLAQFNDISHLTNIVVAMKEDKAIGCGGIMAYDDQSMEIKRMYVSTIMRRRGIGRMILDDLERWCVELGYKKCILFTGAKQPEANRLYEQSGYQRIAKYGKLKDIADSICFAKDV